MKRILIAGCPGSGTAFTAKTFARFCPSSHEWKANLPESGGPPYTVVVGYNAWRDAKAAVTDDDALVLQVRHPVDNIASMSGIASGDSMFAELGGPKNLQNSSLLSRMRLWLNYNCEYTKRACLTFHVEDMPDPFGLRGLNTHKDKRGYQLTAWSEMYDTDHVLAVGIEELARELGYGN